MAHTADPVLLAPSSTSEACLRIEQVMKGAKANGKLVQHRFPHNVTNILFDAGRGPALMSYEIDSVDVTEFCEAVQHDREGRLKRPGGDAWGDGYAVYDTYCHEDEPGDEVVFEIPDSGNPHYGRTIKRPEPLELPDPEPATEEEVQAVLEEYPEATRDEAETIAEVRHNTPPEVLAALLGPELITEDKILAEVERTHVFPGQLRSARRYEPMKSGVWINAGVNEDDVRRAHPDPELDKAYEDVKPAEKSIDAAGDPQKFYDKVHGDNRQFEESSTDAKMDRLATAIETLVELLQQK